MQEGENTIQNENNMCCGVVHILRRLVLSDQILTFIQFIGITSIVPRFGPCTNA